MLLPYLMLKGGIMLRFSMIIFTVIFLAACSATPNNDTGRDILTGTVVGAVIGSTVDRTIEGAAMGGVIGGITSDHGQTSAREVYTHRNGTVVYPDGRVHLITPWKSEITSTEVDFALQTELREIIPELLKRNVQASLQLRGTRWAHEPSGKGVERAKKMGSFLFTFGINTIIAKDEFVYSGQYDCGRTVVVITPGWTRDFCK